MYREALVKDWAKPGGAPGPKQTHGGGWVGWETEQVSRCRTSRECGSVSTGSGRRGCDRETLARTWKEGEARW